MSFLDRILRCSLADRSAYRPLGVAGATVGYVGARVAEALAAFPDVFVVTGADVALAPGLAAAGPDERTDAVAAVVARLSETGVIGRLRAEPYAVAEALGQPALFTVDRAAVPALGVRACGLHLNGFVRRADGLHMWIGRRAEDRAVEPGKYDQLVAGGQPAGLGIEENLLKECAEEAAMPADLARRAVPVGAITYAMELDGGLRRDVLFVYDLEVPDDFTPRNTDGEIAAFELWPIERAAAVARETDDFKFNCSLVVIDFLVRHGLVTPDHPDYVALCEGLRSG